MEETDMMMSLFTEKTGTTFHLIYVRGQQQNRKQI
jgi:hypothetical protein